MKNRERVIFEQKTEKLKIAYLYSTLEKEN